MALYVWDLATGALRSWSPGDADPAADDATLAAAGLAITRGLPLLDDTHAWDVASKTVVEVAAPYKPFMISAGVWILRFTPDEFGAITASADNRVRLLLYALNNADDGQGRKVIDLNSSTVKSGVAYMVSLGLLTQDRSAAILATS